MDTIGERLGFARQLAECSMREISILAGCDPTAVRLIEIGERPDPRGSTLAAVGRVLGCSVDWLISGTGPAPTEEQVRAAVEQARASASSRAQSDAAGPEAA